MSKSIHDIPTADRPREKLLRKGAKALSDQELLAVLVGKGTAGMDVMALAASVRRDAKDAAARCDQRPAGAYDENLAAIAEGLNATRSC